MFKVKDIDGQMKKVTELRKVYEDNDLQEQMWSALQQVVDVIDECKEKNDLLTLEEGINRMSYFIGYILATTELSIDYCNINDYLVKKIKEEVTQ